MIRSPAAAARFRNTQLWLLHALRQLYGYGAVTAYRPPAAFMPLSTSRYCVRPETRWLAKYGLWLASWRPMTSRSCETIWSTTVARRSRHVRRSPVALESTLTVRMLNEPTRTSGPLLTALAVPPDTAAVVASSPSSPAAA